MKKQLLFMVTFTAVFMAGALSSYAAVSDYYTSSEYDGAVEGADLLLRDYNQLLEDINTNYPQMIADMEQQIEEQKEYLDSIDSLDYEDYYKEQLKKETRSKIRRLELELKHLNERLEHKKESLPDYEIAIKQKQDDSLSTAVQTGQSENSDYSSIEEYDEDITEFTSHFWINTDTRTVEGKYRYKTVGLYEGWNYIPFVNELTKLTLCHKDGTVIAADLQRDTARDTEQTLFWTVPAVNADGSEAAVLEKGAEYMLLINGVKYYIKAY